MSWGKALGFGGSQSKKESDIKKKMLLQLCDIEELEQIWTTYVSKSRPRFQYEDGEGLTKYRDTTRLELIDALIKQVPLDGIVKVHKHLKDHLAKIEEGSE